MFFSFFNIESESLLIGTILSV